MTIYPADIIDYIRKGQTSSYGSPKFNSSVLAELASLNIECDGYHGYLPIEENKKFLNIGCGFDYRKGYINIDTNPDMEPDIVMSALDIETKFEPDSITGIVMTHTLNYFHRWQALDFLKMAFNVLELKGRLLIQQQDLLRILNGIVILLENNNKVITMDMVNGILNGILWIDPVLDSRRITYNTAKYSWPSPLLKLEVENAGFKNVNMIVVEPEYYKPAWKDVIIVGTKE